MSELVNGREIDICNLCMVVSLVFLILVQVVPTQVNGSLIRCQRSTSHAAAAEA